MVASSWILTQILCKNEYPRRPDRSPLRISRGDLMQERVPETARSQPSMRIFREPLMQNEYPKQPHSSPPRISEKILCRNEYPKRLHHSPPCGFHRGSDARMSTRNGQIAAPWADFKKGESPWGSAKEATSWLCAEVMFRGYVLKLCASRWAGGNERQGGQEEMSTIKK